MGARARAAVLVARLGGIKKALDQKPRIKKPRFLRGAFLVELDLVQVHHVGRGDRTMKILDVRGAVLFDLVHG